MSALEWLKERQAQSERNRRLFENRPNTLRAGEVATHSMIPASQAWSGYKPGGGLMVRQPVERQPEVKNKLVQKRGDLTMTKEWVDNARFQKDSPGINITPAPQRSRARGIPLPPNVYKRGFQPSPRTLSPGAQAAIAQVQSTGGRNVDAYGEPILSHADISNLRAMREAEVTPTPPKRLRPTRPSEQYWNLRNLSGGYDRYPRPQQVRPQTPPTQSNSYLEDWPLNENQWNTLTDQQFQNAGQGRNNYVFGDTTAPGVGSVPNKTLFSMGIPLPDFNDEWRAAKKKDEMLQRMIRQRLDPSTLRQPYQRSGGRY